MAATPGQVQELHEARAEFDELRSHGSRDAEAVYKKNPEFAAAVASGDPDRAAPARRAMQHETEMRTDPGRRADRFVDRWQKLDQTRRMTYDASRALPSASEAVSTLLTPIAWRTTVSTP